MAVDDEHERDLAQLPQRARPTTTRTDARSLPREVTTVTRPLFTADESADDSAYDDRAHHDRLPDDSSEDDDGDLFDAPQATTADTPLLSDATEFNVARPQLTADSDDVSDESHDDSDDDSDDNSAAVERTVVSLVLPDHLRDAGNDDDSDDEDIDEAAPTQFSIEPRASILDDAPPAREVTESRYVYATKPPEARPAWQFAAMAVAGVVVLAVFVIVIVAAFASTPAGPAPTP